MPAASMPSYLDRRRRSARRRIALSTSSAIAMHVTIAALAFFGPSLFGDIPEEIEYVAVPVLPASALGISEPEPPPPKPQPVEEEKQEPEPVADEEPAPEPPPLPDRPAIADPSAKKSDRPPTPRQEPDRSTQQANERRGSRSGNASGTSSADIAGFDDPDFVYGYYLDQMVGRIRSQWVRPVIGGDVSAIIYFRIHKDGRVSGTRIEESSGYSGFDRAALRAVKAASPLPPLPSSYRKSSLGVNLIVR